MVRDDNAVGTGSSSSVVVLRATDSAGVATVVRHPLDLVERGIEAGVSALEAVDLLDEPHTCLIAVARGSLSGSFTGIYEVVRRCGWSILPLGGSEDPEDIAGLCDAFDVDVLFVSARSIDAVFPAKMAGRYGSVRETLVVGGQPTEWTTSRVAATFPQFAMRPYLLASELTGPVGLSTVGGDPGSFAVLDHVLLEVDEGAGQVAAYGTGDLLATIRGVDDPALVRRSIGQRGVLRRSPDGLQIVDVLPGSPDQAHETDTG